MEKSQSDLERIERKRALIEAIGCDFPHPKYISMLPTSINGRDFDHQEKVSVVLDESKGLVVEGSESKVEGTSTQTPYESRDGRFGENNNCEDCNNLSKEGSPTRLPPFTRERHGSSSTGVSSMTPLMIKENYKIELTIKPSASYLKSQKRKSSINLCCTLVFAFTASLFFSLTLLLAKVLHNREHHPISIAFWRYLGILCPSVPLLCFYIFRERGKLLGNLWPLNDVERVATVLGLLMRAILGATAIILRYSSLNYLALADTSLISYCAPVIAALLAPFCFKKEKGFLIPLCATLLAIAGIFILCRPPLSPRGSYEFATLQGVFLATLSTLCTSGVLLILRNLLQKVHFSIIIFMLGLWGTFEAGVMALTMGVLKVPELLPDIVLLCGLAVLTFFGQLFILLALRVGRMESVSVMRCCDIIFALLWQHLFLKIEPDIYTILSGILIIFTVWFISFRKWVISLRQNNRLRKKLSFILF